MNVPILTKRRESYRRQVEDEAIKKAVAAVGEAMEWTGVAQKGFAGGNALLGNTGLSGAATMLSAKASAPHRPGTSWSNQGSASNALIARVTQNLSSGFARAPEDLELALAEQGLSWGPPFPPGRPLDPFWGYRRPPRTWDYQVGENVHLTPRQGRISFQTLEDLWNGYDVAQICSQHLINDVRSLDYNWEPIPGIKADVSEDIEQAIAFFDSPDKQQPFRAWLAEYLEDVIKFDAGALYIRRNEAGDPIALEVVSGKTIIPLVDFYGRRPHDEEDDHADPEDLFDGATVPAYVQINEGLPWDWLASDDLIYQPWNPQPASQYGRAPLERVLLSANTDIRFQWHFLQFFTEGSVPAGFMEAPPDMSDPAQVAHWQEVWDAVMVGDQGKQTQVRWVPNGSKFTGTKDDANRFDKDFPLYLMRRTCAAHGTTPSDLGFTEEVNKATGDTQIDVQFRVGTSPLLRHVEDVVGLFVKQHLKLRCRLRIDDGRETEDRVATATADGIYLDHGVKGVDEVRQDLGLHVDKSRPMPRYINNTRSGPIPLLALESMAGEIDPETYGPADSQKPVVTPFSPPPGVIPPTGSPEQLEAAEHTAQSARDLVKATAGEAMASDPTKGEDESEEAEGGEEGGAEKEARITALLQGSYAGYGCGQIWVNAEKKRVLINFGDGEGDQVDEVRELAAEEWPDFEIESDAEVGYPGVRRFYDSDSKEMKEEPVPGWELSPLSAAPPTKQEVAKGADNTGGPGITRGFSNPSTMASTTKLAAEGSPTTIVGGTDGITVELGMGGEDLLDDDEDEEDDDVVKAEYVALALRRWRDNSRNRLRKGRAPRRFVDPNLPQGLHDEVWAKLSVAKGREEVDAAFADVGKPSAGERPATKAKAKRPPFHHNADAIVEHYAPLIGKALGSLFSDADITAAINAGNERKEQDSLVKELSLQEKADAWGLSTNELSAEQHAYVEKATEVDEVRQAAIDSLKAKASVSELESVLKPLYGDSLLQGAHDAAEAAHVPVVASLADVADSTPAGYWDSWVPGYGEAAAQAADGGMRALLDEAGHTIVGLEETTIDRIGQLVSEGLGRGDSIQTVGKAIRVEVESPGRAELIANTEYARAMTTASEQTYSESGVEEEEWLGEGDMCPECQVNADASPIKQGDDWPNGSVPVHPRCRCAQAGKVSVPDAGGA